VASSPEPYDCHHCFTDQIPLSDLTNEELQKLFNYYINDKHIYRNFIFWHKYIHPTGPDIWCECYDQSSFIKCIKNERKGNWFLLHYNVRSLLKKNMVLQQYLSELTSNPDVIAITQTCLNQANIDMFNTFRAAWFRRFLQKKQQFLVALPTP